MEVKQNEFMLGDKKVHLLYNSEVKCIPGVWSLLRGLILGDSEYAGEELKVADTVFSGQYIPAKNVNQMLIF